MNHTSSSLFATLSTLSFALLAGCGGGAYSPRYYNNGYGSTGYAPGYGAGAGYNAGYNPNGAQPVPAAGGTPVAPGADINTQLQSIDRYLRPQGYMLSRNLTQQPLTPNGTVNVPIETQPGQCYVVFALGDGGIRNLDLRVTAPSTRFLGRDSGRDAHPSVSFCALEYGYHMARFYASEGGGNFTMGVYTGPANTQPNLNSVLNTATASMTVAPTQPDPATAARIATLGMQMQQQGYQVVRPPEATVMTQGQTLEWPTTLPGGACFTFALFGGQGVGDADLFLTDSGTNRQVASDGGTSVDAVLRNVCLTQTGTYRLRPRMFRGNGPVWLQIFERANPTVPGAVAQVDPNNTQNATQNPGAQNTAQNVAPGPVVTPPPTAGQPVQLTVNMQASSNGDLDSIFRDLEVDFRTRGYASAGQPQNGQLPANGDGTAQFSVDATSCYALVAAGSETVQNLDLALTDASGSVIARDHGTDSTPVVRFCPHQAGALNVAVHLAAGQGSYRLRLYRWSGGSSGAGMSGLLFVRNAEVTRVLQADSYQGDANFELLRTRMREGASVTRPVVLEAGQCYAFVAVGGDGVSDLNLTLQQGSNTVAQDPVSSGFPAARYCARTAGTYRVVIRSNEGGGDVVFRVFRQQGQAGNRAAAATAAGG